MVSHNPEAGVYRTTYHIEQSSRDVFWLNLGVWSVGVGLGQVVPVLDMVQCCHNRLAVGVNERERPALTANGYRELIVVHQAHLLI